MLNVFSILFRLVIWNRIYSQFQSAYQLMLQENKELVSSMEIARAMAREEDVAYMFHSGICGTVIE